MISIEQAARQANEIGLSFENEIAQLILHGLLHLSGYDHETDRRRNEPAGVKLRKHLELSRLSDLVNSYRKCVIHDRFVYSLIHGLPFTSPLWKLN